MIDTIPSTEKLAISVRDGTLHVKRHLDFTNGTIDLNLSFTVPNGQDLTVGQIDTASIRVVMEHLQLLLERADTFAALAPPPTALPGTPTAE